MNLKVVIKQILNVRNVKTDPGQFCKSMYHEKNACHSKIKSNKSLYMFKENTSHVHKTIMTFIVFHNPVSGLAQVCGLHTHNHDHILDLFAVLYKAVISGEGVVIIQVEATGLCLASND